MPDRKKSLAACLLIFLNLAGLFAQKQPQGTISGFVFEKSSDQPVEFAQVVLKGIRDTTYLKATATDSKGAFVFEKAPAGTYKIIYSFIGYTKEQTSLITIDSKQNKINIGKIYFTETSQALNEVEVTGHRSTFVNSIDRKTFNVGEDLMSKTGSASELLRNVPSVQVDVDGNVSLRGSENVTILVDGKPSAMMNLNRAATLEQLPANSIEKIEIITNPSAKYRPDGTSGIINIVLKKNKSLGLNGNIAANVGNQGRFNGSAALNYNPGKLNIFGNIAFRKDDRKRTSESFTKEFQNGSLSSSSYNNSESHAQPTSTIGGLGADYKLNDYNKIGISGNYNYRFQRQYTTWLYNIDSAGLITDYTRERYLPETETDLEYTAFFQHNFGKEGHDLNVNYTSSLSTEHENNYYSNFYRLPLNGFNYDNMFYRHQANESQLLAEYANTISEKSKLEAGYELDYTNNDMDLHRDTTAMNRTVFAKDNYRSSNFRRTEYTNVLYVTFEHEIGKFGFLAGLRAEQTNTKANLVSTNLVINSNYSRLYPSLHLSYNVTGSNELQLNYSHRINRPEDEQLNPFSEYQDILNIRTGNPYLKPEDIHSFEFGYQYKKQSTTFLSTIYYRYKYNSITSITKIKGDTLISTLENLDKNTSAGLELILSTAIGKFASMNFSSNTFYDVINAAKLGYGKDKADISFLLNANIGINISKSTVWQVSANYTGERLTPQGKQLPFYIVNTGLKQELLKKKAALIFTYSDVFNSLRNNSIIDTPELYRKNYNRRTSQIFYLGFTYSFGITGTKPKENGLKYDNQL